MCRSGSAPWTPSLPTCPVPALASSGKKPDIRYKNLKELEDLPALQLKILEAQASYVRPGGTLLYSTCTVLKRENEDVVSAFLAAHGGFTTEPLPLPDVFPKNETGMLTLIPGERTCPPSGTPWRGTHLRPEGGAQAGSARDGTIKYLWELSDGNCVETVLMRYHYGNTVCISSEVGCRMGCAFCASTIGGLVRRLRTL